ncbi:MAG: hypothetical protein ACMG6E_09250 [Candidatus Roizmanbacteria bacterium]
MKYYRYEDKSNRASLSISPIGTNNQLRAKKHGESEHELSLVESVGFRGENEKSYGRDGNFGGSHNSLRKGLNQNSIRDTQETNNSAGNTQSSKLMNPIANMHMYYRYKEVLDSAVVSEGHVRRTVCALCNEGLGVPHIT